MSEQNPVNYSEFWEGRYKEGTTGWDMGGYTPVLDEVLGMLGDISDKTIAVIGCGNGHDAIHLATKAKRVVGFDFAHSAIENSRKNAIGLKNIEFTQADLFDLPNRIEFSGYFDIVFEHTCFCAIDPGRYDEYAEVVHRLLQSNGVLAGIFYAHGREGGPPYTTSEAQVRDIFSESFNVEYIAKALKSIESRKEQELIGILRKRG